MTIQEALKAAQEKTIEQAKAEARNALACLSNAIDDELRNMDRFEDERMLVATGDLERHYKEMIEACDRLAELYEDWKYNQREEWDNRGPEPEEWRHQAAEAMRLKR